MNHYSYQIFTDSNCDLSKELRNRYNIEYLHMLIEVDGKILPADLDWETYSYDEFYQWMKDGRKILTHSVTAKEFENKFIPYLEKGLDILYIGCSSALSTCINIAKLVASKLLKKYKDRHIVVIDSLSSSCALGMMCIAASDFQKEGKDIDEVAIWVEEHKNNFNLFATVETLSYMKRAGRITGSKAFMGNIFGVKPIFITDSHGYNLGIKNVRGLKNADVALIDGVRKTIKKEYCNRVIIGHALCLPRAIKIKKLLEKELDIIVSIELIGPIVGTTCGPGTIAVFCYGETITRFLGDGKELIG